MTKAIAIAVCLGVAFGYIMANDYEDQVLEEQYYCDMVKAKAWPAYREGVTCK